MQDTQQKDKRKISQGYLNYLPQLKEYSFPEETKGKNSMWQLLQAIRQCGLKDDALMDIFYEQIADGYPVDYDAAIFVFHGVYDVPLKAKDKESLWESEEVYDFIICRESGFCLHYRRNMYADKQSFSRYNDSYCCFIIYSCSTVCIFRDNAGR